MLFLVLVFLSGLALLASGVTALARRDLRMAGELRDAAVAEAAAEGGVTLALFHLVPGAGAAWTAPGLHRLALNGATVDIRLDNHAGRINPNTASPALLRALLTALGESPDRAAALTAAIADWRERGRRPRPRGAKAAEYRAAGLSYGPPGEAFRDLGELRLVLGMTPALLAALRPHLTLWWDGDPDPAFASVAVRQALETVSRANALSGSRGSGIAVVEIASDAGIGTARARRRVIVQIDPRARDRPWRLVAIAPPGP